jgi:hypothetical protein
MDNYSIPERLSQEDFKNLGKAIGEYEEVNLLYSLLLRSETIYSRI